MYDDRCVTALFFVCPIVWSFFFFSQNRLLSQDEKEKHYISFDR